MSDETQAKCRCARCRMGSLMGPVILITIGVLFLIGEFSNRVSFGELWPVILIAIGAVKLLEASASTEGHISKENRS
jgi:hypothetical protein